MNRYEHCMIEFYWSQPAGIEASRFKPSFRHFRPDGTFETHVGGNAELAAFFSRLGADGWRMTSGITASNWILYTMERSLP